MGSAGPDQESSDGGSTSSQETVIRRDRNPNEPRPASPTFGPFRAPARPTSASREKGLGSSEIENPESTRNGMFTARGPISPSPRFSARPPLVPSSKPPQRSLLPDVLYVSLKTGWLRNSLDVIVDCRTLIENILLSGALAFAAAKYKELSRHKLLGQWTFIGK